MQDVAGPPLAEPRDVGSSSLQAGGDQDPPRRRVPTVVEADVEPVRSPSGAASVTVPVDELAAVARDLLAAGGQQFRGRQAVAGEEAGMWAAGALRGSPASTTATGGRRGRGPGLRTGRRRPADDHDVVLTHAPRFDAWRGLVDLRTLLFPGIGVEMSTVDDADRRRPSPPPSTWSARGCGSSVRSGAHADRLAAQHRDLEEHAVAAGERAAAAEPRAAAPAGAGLPRAARRPGRRARGGRPAHPAQAGQRQRPHGAPADPAPGRRPGLEDRHPDQQGHAPSRAPTTGTSGSTCCPAGCGSSSATRTRCSAPARPPSSTPRCRTGSAARRRAGRGPQHLRAPRRADARAAVIIEILLLALASAVRRRASQPRLRSCRTSHAGASCWPMSWAGWRLAVASACCSSARSTAFVRPKRRSDAS